MKNLCHLQKSYPSLILAPMEGVMDAPMRAVLAEAGGFDFAVSEFFRVSQNVIAAKHFKAHIPELLDSPPFPTLLPLQVQLLGSHAERLAASATEACIAGARAIDLNLGCPSPTVNRHCGGAALLKTPSQIRALIEALRKALPPAIPVSAKIRLGWENPEEVFEIAQAVSDGGASWLVIHARTRAEKYRPGVHWEPLARLVQTLPVPIVANGDLFTIDDFSRCKQLSQCQHFMVGRGTLLDPLLGHHVQSLLGRPQPKTLFRISDPNNPLACILGAARRYAELAAPSTKKPGYLTSRLKQWFAVVRNLRPDLISKPLMTQVVHAQSVEELFSSLEL